jgi:predicted kinase
VVRVNQDLIRLMIHGEWFTPNRVLERRVAKVKEYLIEGFMRQQVAVIISDDTNLHPESIPTLERLAKLHRYDFEVRDFTGVPVEECIRRDAARDRRVGPDVILEMARRYGLLAPEPASV